MSAAEAVVVEEERLQYLAVGAHPDGKTKSVIGETVTGAAMVQIWSAPYDTDATSASTVLPTMQIGICHQGGLTWDCKWCPADTSTSAGNSNDTLPRYGCHSELWAAAEAMIALITH